uniref:Exocyst subunit Exo70 family protein n=1 Tax=Oryza punctata TaxID=4537 RepID=A0A0E0KX23_ORYPU
MEQAAEEEEALRAKIELLRQAMQTSEAMQEEAAVVGTRLNTHMAAIDKAMRSAHKRAYNACRVHDNIRRSLTAAGAIVRHLDLVREAEHVILLDRPNEDLNAYLEAVDKLTSVKYFFTSKIRCRVGNDVHERANELLSKAIHGLENEFHRLLTKCRFDLEHIFNCLPCLNRQLSSEKLIGPSAGDYSEAPLKQYAECTLPTLVEPCYLTLLSKLAQKSIQLDCHQKFMEIYREIRSSTLERTLKHLGVEYVTKEEMQQVEAQSLKAKIAEWTQFSRITVKLLFGAERILCDQVFEGKYTWKDHCFAEVTAKSLSILLSFGDAVVQSQTLPDKLHILLDMYKATLELQSKVDAIFEGNGCSENRKSALTLTKSLAQTAKKTIGDFMEYIVNHSVTSTTIDGAVHYMTSYIFGDPCVEDEKDTAVISQIVGTIHALETNLAMKAKQYKDLALGHLFLMNNIHYIVKSIGRSEVKGLLGADWIERQRRIVQQHASQYRRVAWLKVLEYLSTQGLTSSLGSSIDVTQGSFRNIKNSTTSRSVIKERLKCFNMRFEEVCQKQMNWDVPDRDLRDSLILMIAEILLPAYRSFLKHFGPLVENSHSALKYMKYTPESLEQALGNLFAKKLLSDQAKSANKVAGSKPYSSFAIAKAHGNHEAYFRMPTWSAAAQLGNWTRK